MRHASYHVADTVLPASVLRQKTRPTSIVWSIFEKIFAWVLAALHHSRRLQAKRILRQYQHLIADPKEVSKQVNLNNFIPNIGDDKNVGE